MQILKLGNYSITCKVIQMDSSSNFARTNSLELAANIFNRAFRTSFYCCLSLHVLTAHVLFALSTPETF